MKWTNKANLPEPLVNKLVYQPSNRTDRLSVTRLVNAPRAVELLRRHDGDIEQDAAEVCWRLLGSAVHYVLDDESHGSIPLPEGYHSEEWLEAYACGMKIVGRADLRSPDGTLSDYKTTSVYSFLLGDKPDWERQLNTYAWLYRANGIEIERLQIVAILRDWVKSKALANPDYPNVPFWVMPVKMWTPLEQNGYITERVRLHMMAQDQEDDNLPECTAEERWEKPPVWKVIKKGKTRGRNFNTETEAVAYKDNRKEYEIHPFAGEWSKCERFCLAAPFCNQFKKHKEAQHE